MSYKTAVIVDIVRSRELSDRASAQRAIEDAFAEADRHESPDEPLWATVGDEFQAVYPSVPAALRATLLARLLLQEGLDIRIGFGEGEAIEIDRRAEGRSIQDGSAWWHAREAIEEAHRREDRGSPYVRSWFLCDDRERASSIASYLLLRDQIISRMSERARRLTAGSLLGRSQESLAEEEGISQPAVSQNLLRSGGAALLASVLVLGEGTER